MTRKGIGEGRSASPGTTLLAVVTLSLGCGRIDYERIGVDAQGGLDGAPGDAAFMGDAAGRDGSMDGGVGLDGGMTLDSAVDGGRSDGGSSSCTLAGTGGCSGFMGISLFPGQTSMLGGDTTNAGDAMSGSCGGDGSGERHYVLSANSGDVAVTVRTEGATFRGVFYLQTNCGGSEIACQAAAPGQEASLTFLVADGTSRSLFLDGAEPGECGTADVVVEQMRAE
jgi:hypothetical protein